RSSGPWMRLGPGLDLLRALDRRAVVQLEHRDPALAGQLADVLAPRHLLQRTEGGAVHALHLGIVTRLAHRLVGVATGVAPRRPGRREGPVTDVEPHRPSLSV